MDDFNIHEKRTIDLIQKLTFALELNDQDAIEDLEVEHNKIDSTEVRSSLLDQLVELYNYKNYGREYS
ncbi:MAG: hypothetical protein ACFCU6_02750 [Balneolaceae bacterium]